MRDSLIYVHYEPLAHMFATAGVTASDVLTAHSRPWHHLLLLPPVSDDELIDPHTGFNVVSGQQEITTWLRSKEARNRAWLDFRHGPYLQELTPNEIAELLYLAHMRTHIQPPFYYKLQNSLVFIPQKSELATLYFRQTRQFDETLSAAIVRHLRLAANEQPFWLRLRQQDFPSVAAPVMTALYPLLEEGVMLDFGAGVFSKANVVVPLLTPRGRFVPERQDELAQSQRRGQLELDRTSGTWRLAAE